ncbi:MAG: hypothetical protein F4X97_04740 [Boseongicola sp. SB0662_bin_57]|nr:hypothetical protein [Boseongicola sp. SB0662_bin_57]
MADSFEKKDRRRVDVIEPLSRSEVVDVSGGDHEFSNVTRAIMVTGDGNLAMRLKDDSADLTLAVTAGAFLPLRVSHVRDGSTATAVGFW